MRKDWILIAIIGLILVVGLGLFGFLKLSKKEVTTNPVPSGPEVAGTSSEEFFAEDAKVMYFYSDFCHWCQKEKDEVLPGLGKDGYRVKSMNVGQNPDLGKQYNISGTPTFVASNGDRLVGFQETAALKTFLDQHK
ncbi:MAG: hypothetical protein HW405_200 [Candidatus Berkelbacteria bacterium]|nr:hypothetical protein [Candidatus Berkelbacteria bacterium]